MTITASCGSELHSVHNALNEEALPFICLERWEKLWKSGNFKAAAGRLWGSGEKAVTNMPWGQEGRGGAEEKRQQAMWQCALSWQFPPLFYIFTQIGWCSRILIEHTFILILPCKRNHHDLGNVSSKPIPIHIFHSWDGFPMKNWNCVTMNIIKQRVHDKIMQIGYSKMEQNCNCPLCVYPGMCLIMQC